MSDIPATWAATPADRIARIRPLTAAAAVGAIAGLAIGCAYLGGTTARASALRDQAFRLEGATSAGFTEEALSAAAGGLDDSALTIARRHDPYTVAGGAQRDRQAELMTARLEQLRIQAGPQGLRRVGFSPAVGGAAQPFHLSNALDQSRDLECLTQAAYYEARGEGLNGMRAVAQVVLNRSRHAAFPRTVCGVVFQGAGRRTGCQFSFTCDGSMRGPVNASAWRRARDVASAALSGAVYSGVGNATHFHTTAVAPGWRNAMIRVGQVGDHVFYRFGGRNGAGSSFAYQPRPSIGGGEAQPQLQHASIAPTSDGPVAYAAVVAQENGEAAASRTASPAPASAPAAPAVVQVETNPAV